MVTRSPAAQPEADLSDDGYAPDGVTNTSAPVVTRFTNAAGKVSFDTPVAPVNYRARAQGYVDATFPAIEGELVMQRMTPEQEIASYPSNVWLSQLDFGGDEGLKKTFQLNCAFCHQQASPFMRNERTEEQWLSVIERMNTYGARLPTDDHQKVATLLREEYRRLREHPETVPAPRPWEDHLAAVEITEWPIGDGFSQMHDFLLHPNGYIYIGDNLFDRIYELDPVTGEYTVYKVPHDEDMGLGGIMGNRFKVFPKMYNYMGVHSFAYSKKDGNIFITPSMQQALLEFDIETKKFITHYMPEGYYPHTIRVDDKDRVWFTLALSSQVAMFDRTKKSFTVYDLPARGMKEWLILKALPVIFSISPENRPQPDPDREGTGLPMPYGIDITPDGMVWVARLYANDLARIDPETGEITMIDFPFQGPRRLRADADGNLWIVAFQDSLLVKYAPATGEFTSYKLPVINEVPYALNVDRERGVVWVNGNQSDTILAFDIASEQWQVYPLPRQRFFTRDIEISEDDGAVYTTNSHFPTWQSEGGVPTLLRITPLAE
jgi:streptogramin lyase